MKKNEMTTVEHWEGAWTVRPRLRFPSNLSIGTYNIKSLLQGYLRPGARFIELGCAPGKILAWAGRATQSPVAGIDYSLSGAETAKWLCSGLGIQADIRCEDVRHSTFPTENFDIVFSCGLIEHFEDPSVIIDAHIRLVKPTGVAVIAIPNYGGIYGRLQRKFNPENLALHNLNIMNEGSLAQSFRADSRVSARAFKFGRPSPWLISFEKRWGVIGHPVAWVLNALSHLQPVEIESLKPLLVLELRRQ